MTKTGEEGHAGLMCRHASAYPMHHYGPDGLDYGPTGYLWCESCCEAIWDENESAA